MLDFILAIVIVTVFLLFIFGAVSYQTIISDAFLMDTFPFGRVILCSILYGPLAILMALFFSLIEACIRIYHYDFVNRYRLKDVLDDINTSVKKFVTEE